MPATVQSNMLMLLFICPWGLLTICIECSLDVPVCHIVALYLAAHSYVPLVSVLDLKAFSCWVVSLSYPQIVYLLIVWLAACQALVRRCMIWHVHPFLFLCVGTVLLPTIICERFHGSCFIWILQPHALCSQFASYLGSISIGTLIVAHSFHFYSFFPLALVAFVIVWQHYWPSSVIRQTADIHLFPRSPNILARGSHIAGSTTSQFQ